VACSYNRRNILAYFADEKGWKGAKLYLALLDYLPTWYKASDSYERKVLTKNDKDFIELFTLLLSSEEIGALNGKEILFVIDQFKQLVDDAKSNPKLSKLKIENDLHNNPLGNLLQKINLLLNENKKIIDDLISDEYGISISNLIRSFINTCSPHENENQFKKIRELGRGSFGAVYHVIKKEEPAQIFALKIPVDDDTDIENEIQWLNYIKAAATPTEKDLFIHKISLCFTKYGKRGMVLELFRSCLKKKLKTLPSGMLINSVQKIALQYFNVLVFLHKHRIVHADLKPANTLIDHNERIVICDFGSAYREGTPTYDVLVTTDYRAPEILATQKPYTSAIDMWSVATIIGELISGKPLFPYQGNDDVQWWVHEAVLEKSYPESWQKNLLPKEMGALPAEPTLTKILQDRNLTNTAWNELLGEMLAIEPQHRPHPNTLSARLS
jgi:hypothetical protein